MTRLKFVVAFLLCVAATGSHAENRAHVVEGREAAPSFVDNAAEANRLARLVEHPNLRKYERLLTRASAESGVELALLKAIVAAESGFDPGAVSPKGALGLMQVLPSTAESHGLRADKRKSVEEKLLEPETNIRLGARYLACLLRVFPEQLHLVIASYNAGEGAVQKYRNNIPPFSETRSYVQRVTQLYEAFQAGAAVVGSEALAFETRENGRKRVHVTLRARAAT